MSTKSTPVVVHNLDHITEYKLNIGIHEDLKNSIRKMMKRVYPKCKESSVDDMEMKSSDDGEDKLYIYRLNDVVNDPDLHCITEDTPVMFLRKGYGISFKNCSKDKFFLKFLTDTYNARLNIELIKKL